MSDQASIPVTCALHGDGVAVITIDRPRRRNALNLDVKQRLVDAVLTLNADASVRVIVLTGAGGYFVAGTDIDEMASMTPTSHTLGATDLVFTALRQSSKPTIAAVEGYALGGGCELALACDLIVAAEGARFGQPEI
ncbi:MAG: enoyl-CoA hydratase-related protein, partial [Massilia sp.]